jgi:hypothetical protein
MITRRALGATAAMVLIWMLWMPSVLAAEKLRVGKAVAEAFSFVPPDVGMRAGIFQKNNIDLELIAFAGDARMQQAAAADSIDILLGSGPAMAFIAKGSPIKGIAAMAGPPLLLAAGWAKDARRSQGQDRQRLHRRVAHLLAGERNLAPSRLGPERHQHRPDGRHAGADCGAQAR